MLSPARQGLFDRLGGFDTLERAVTEFVSRLASAPEFAGLVPSARAVDARWQLQLLLTELLGGPMAYDGPDPAALRQAAGVDAERVAGLIELLISAFAAGGTGGALLTELRAALVEFAQSLGLASADPAPEGVAGRGPGVGNPVAALVRQAEAAMATAGLSDWPLFVLDADLLLVHQSEAACAVLLSCDADLRRAFRLGAMELTGNSVLRFHSAPTQLHGLLNDTLRLPREVTWSFGRTTWRARLFALPAAGPGRPGFAIAWRDESEAHRRETILARLKAQAEELPVPVMFPDAEGELWFGNAACEHALARLTPWLPASFDPSNGIPGALFFPDGEERRSLFTAREALPLKKRMTFGPETISLLVSAVCDDDQRMLCPQVTWEIVHSIAPVLVVPPPPALVTVPPAVEARPVVHSRPRGVNEVSGALRREARALETSALALSSLSEVLDSLADHAAGEGAGTSAAGLENAVDGGEAAARLAEQGLAALDAAREIAAGDLRQRAVAAALGRLMAIARRTNRLVLDASLSVVEDSMGDSVGKLVDHSAAVRAAVDAGAGALATQAHDVARQLTQAVGTASRLAELRDSLQEVAPPPVVRAVEGVLA